MVGIIWKVVLDGKKIMGGKLLEFSFWISSLQHGWGRNFVNFSSFLLSIIPTHKHGVNVDVSTSIRLFSIVFLHNDDMVILGADRHFH